MTESNDLYTDYALQIFSSWISGNPDSMMSVLESFKNDGKNQDSMFMPGIIFGLMYHMNLIFTALSEMSETSVEELFSSYALDYAIGRELLLDNPLLNVAKAKQFYESFIEQLQNLEDLGDLD